MKLLIRAAIMVAVGLIRACVPQVELTPTRETITAPSDRESCEALGGQWGRLGLAPEEECNLPTSDAGKVCSDWDDCEGACIAELSQDDLDNAPEVVVYTEGKCSAWRIIVGCHAFVEDGRVHGILCVD